MWAGGKTKMMRYYAPLLPHRLPPGGLVEPFAGSAALFSHLSLGAGARGEGPVSAILSDVNAEIMMLYEAVRDDPVRIIDGARALCVEWAALTVAQRKTLYYVLRQRYWDMPLGDPAAIPLLYFLMKTSFNGIWQTCRASGGRFGTPVGLATQKAPVIDPETVMAWSAMLARTQIMTGDYAALDVPAGAFVFCDPPYRDSFTSYGVVFDDREQRRLVDWCRTIHRERAATVWLSNRDAGDGFFESHAAEAVLHRFPVTYTAGRRKRSADGYAAKPATELLMVWDHGAAAPCGRRAEF